MVLQIAGHHENSVSLSRRATCSDWKVMAAAAEALLLLARTFENQGAVLEVKLECLYFCTFSCDQKLIRW